MKKLDKKAIIMPAIALFIICLVSAFLLAGTNALTKDKIAENLKMKEAESRSVVISNASEFVDGQTVTANNKEVSYCTALDESGNTLGYIFTCINKGYGGDVSVMTAVDTNGRVIRAVVLSMDDETPGLGQKAGRDDFLSLFTGKSGVLSWVKNGAGEKEVQGVTSATFTSKAVIQCVNDALEAYRIITGGEA
ncbi:MAG: FMN-binding protein [Clostridia bacterium]|nr:FMN-binding protein [Clostridia bacterium]